MGFAPFDAALRFRFALVGVVVALWGRVEGLA
jgi:hypothetical protein